MIDKFKILNVPSEYYRGFKNLQSIRIHIFSEDVLLLDLD